MCVGVQVCALVPMMKPEQVVFLYCSLFPDRHSLIVSPWTWRALFYLEKQMKITRQLKLWPQNRKISRNFIYNLILCVGLHVCLRLPQRSGKGVRVQLRMVGRAKPGSPARVADAFKLLSWSSSLCVHIKSSAFKSWHRGYHFRMSKLKEQIGQFVSWGPVWGGHDLLVLEKQNGT